MGKMKRKRIDHRQHDVGRVGNITAKNRVTHNSTTCTAHTSKYKHTHVCNKSQVDFNAVETHQ